MPSLTMTKEELDRKRLAAFLRVFQRVVRIMTGDPRATLTLSDSDRYFAWTDGQHIEMSEPKIMEKLQQMSLADLLPSLKGGVFHEMGHNMVTPRNDQWPFAKMVKASASLGVSDDSTRMARNMLEDQRMEMALWAQYLPMEPYFVKLNAEWMLKQNLELVGLHALLHGRKFMPRKIRRAARNAWVAMVTKETSDPVLAEANAADVEGVIDEYIRLDLAKPKDRERSYGLIAKMGLLLEQAGLSTPDADDNDDQLNSGQVDKNQSEQMAERANEVADEVDEEDAEEDEAEAESNEDEDDSPGPGSEGEEEDEGEDDTESDDGESTDADGDEPESGEEDEANDDEVDGQGEGGDEADEEGEDESDGSGVGTDDGDGDEEEGDSDGQSDDDGESGDSDESAPDKSDDEANGVSTSADETIEREAEAMKEMAQELLEDVNDDEQLAEDVKADMASINAELEKEHKPAASLDRSWTTWGVTGSMRQTASRSTDVLRRLRSEVEPRWETEQYRGRLNVRRVMDRQRVPGDFDVFDQWNEGGEDEVGIESVLLVDLSSSMNGANLVNPSMSDFQLALQAAWTVKRMHDSIEMPCTVLGFGDTWGAIYTAHERAHEAKWGGIAMQGSTQPAAACHDALQILAASKQKNRVLMVLTDGRWSSPMMQSEEELAAEDAIRKINGLGATTVLAALGVAQNFGPHECQRLLPIDTPMQLVKAMETIVAATLRRA